MASPARANPRIEQLRQMLADEIAANRTKRGWGGTGIAIDSNQFSLTQEQREDTNEQGIIHGCHTCDSRLEIDRTQPWVGDHFPPTGLSKAARRALAQVFRDRRFVDGSPQILWAQCHDCSHHQAETVRRLNGMSEEGIVKWLEDDRQDQREVRDLIVGRLPPQLGSNCIRASGSKVTEGEHALIQGIGGRFKCHSNPAHRVPAITYMPIISGPRSFARTTWSRC